MNKLGWTLLALLGWIQHVVAQSPLDQRISINVSAKPLEEVLYSLIEESDVHLSFRNDQLPEQWLVSVRLKRQPLSVVLTEVLKGTGLVYQLVGDQVLLLPRSKPPPEAKFTISGFVTDAVTGERLIGAHIADQLGLRGAVSNEYGFFSLTLTAGEVQLETSYLGYESRRQRLLLAEHISLDIQLSSNTTLPEIVVVPTEGTAANSSQPLKPPTNGDLLLATQYLPSLTGEPDPIRTLHLLPGIQTGTDGVEGLHIRGGDPGQNLVLIDGVPVYNISHAAGLFSVFNAGAIRSASLLTGSFPARYGGRLSGVLDIHTRDGNLNKLSGSAEIGLLTGRLSLEGPIIKGRTSFFISARQSFLHHYLTPYTRELKAAKDEDGQTDYRYYDINAKLSHIFSPKDRLYFSFYKGADGYADGGDKFDQIAIQNIFTGTIIDYDVVQSYRETINWGNTVGALRWNHLFNDKVFANLTLTRSELAVESSYRQFDSIYVRQLDQVFRGFNLGRFRTGIEDVGVRVDVHILPKPEREFRFGVAYNKRLFRPGALELDETSDSPDDELANNPISSTEVNFYGEGQYALRRGWRLHAGVHIALWQVRLSNYPTFQPRLELSKQLSPQLDWRVSASRMVQFVHLLSNATIGLPTDLWVPSTDRVKPARSWNFSSALQWNIGQQWRLSSEVYYKAMDQLVSYSEGAATFRNWEQNVTSGEGQAYGLETMFSKTSGVWTGWASYTLAWANRRFDNINFGRTYPFKYDRRHDAKLAIVYHCKSWLHFSASYLYSTGFAFSIPLEKYKVVIPGTIIPIEGVDVTSFGEKNQFRMPAYHRLDLNAQAVIKSRSNKVRHVLNAGVYNVYNRKNPLYYDVRRRYVNSNNTLISVREFVQVWLLPALPSLSYRLEF